MSVIPQCCDFVAAFKWNTVCCYCSMFQYTFHRVEMIVNKTINKGPVLFKVRVRVISDTFASVFHSITSNKSRKYL